MPILGSSTSTANKDMVPNVRSHDEKYFVKIRRQIWEELRSQARRDNSLNLT